MRAQAAAISRAAASPLAVSMSATTGAPSPPRSPRRPRPSRPSPASRLPARGPLQRQGRANNRRSRRAPGLAEAATPSSRSRMTASVPAAKAFAHRSGRSAGTKRNSAKVEKSDDISRAHSCCGGFADQRPDPCDRSAIRPIKQNLLGQTLGRWRRGASAISFGYSCPIKALFATATFPRESPVDCRLPRGWRSRHRRTKARRERERVTKRAAYPCQGRFHQ